MKIREMFEKLIKNQPSREYWSKYNSRIQDRLQAIENDKKEVKINLGPVSPVSRLRPAFYACACIISLFLAYNMFVVINKIEEIKACRNYINDVKDAGNSRFLLKNMLVRQIVAEIDPVVIISLESSIVMAEKNNTENIKAALDNIITYEHNKNFIPRALSGGYGFIREKTGIPVFVKTVWADTENTGAAQLLKEAIKKEEDKELGDAKSILRRIIREYDGTPESRISRIMLGWNFEKQRVSRRLESASLNNVETLKADFLLGNSQKIADRVVEAGDDKLKFITAFSLKEVGRDEDAVKVFREISDKNIKIKTASRAEEGYVYLKNPDSRLEGIEILKSLGKQYAALSTVESDVSKAVEAIVSSAEMMLKMAEGFEAGSLDSWDIEGKAKITTENKHGGERSLMLYNGAKLLKALDKTDKFGRVTFWVYDPVARYNIDGNKRGPSFGVCNTIGDVFVLGLNQIQIIAEKVNFHCYYWCSTEDGNFYSWWWPNENFGRDSLGRGWHKWVFTFSPDRRIRVEADSRAKLSLPGSKSKFTSGFSGIYMYGGEDDTEVFCIDDIRVEYE